MATVTPEMIKQLREATNAGMLDCKKALTESNGDMEGAITYLRKKGLSKAAKVADKIAAEGLIEVKIADDFKSGTITEVNCETDFVAKNENFKGFIFEMTEAIHVGGYADVESFKSHKFGSLSFEDKMGEAVSRIGEKIEVRRFESFKVGANGVVNGYLHANGRVGVVVAVECDSAKTADAVRDITRDIAMHAAAMKPAYLDESAVPQDAIDREKDIAIEQLKKEGKPEAMIEKIVPGKIKKFVQENSLVGQAFVKDDKKTVGEALVAAAKTAGGTAKLVAFARYEVGEGMIKKGCSFAEEVASQTQR
jgi:elongation factor Ts